MIIEMRVSMKVPDDVSPDQLDGFAASVRAVVDEPVYGHDPSGNELRFSAEDVEFDMVTTRINART